MSKEQDRIISLEDDFEAKTKQLIATLERTTGLDWLVVQGLRTIAEQDALYAQGRSTKGSIVTNAKGGQSAHNFGYAFDICPLKNGELWWNAPEKYWVALGNIAEGMGLTWGGHFKSITDKPHVEDPAWKAEYEAWKKGQVKIG